MTYTPKICAHNNVNFYEIYADKIYNKLLLIINANGKLKHIYVKNIDYLVIKENHDVYCKYNGDEYQVYTPTVSLSQMSPLYANDISDIVIDHVKPICKTLTHLGSNGLLPELDKISSIIRKVNAKTGLTGNDLENAAFDEWLKNNCKPTIDMNALANELEKIINDSNYILISANANSSKGGKIYVNITSTHSSFSKSTS